VPGAPLASVLAGAVSVAFVALIAAAASGAWAAGAAGLLTALSPIHTLASRGATAEVVLVMFASLSLWLALRVDAGGRRLEAAAHGLAVGGLASASAAGLGLAILQLAWLATRFDRRTRTAVSMGIAGIVAALAGALGVLHSPLAEGAEVIRVPSTTAVGIVRCAGASFTRVAGFEYQLLVSRALYLSPLTLVVMALALVGAWSLQRRLRWLLLGGVAVPFALGALLALLTGRVTPLQAGRMIVALPALLVLAGAGLASLRGRALVATAAMVLGATTLFLGLALVSGF
jgi:hypothetical protein